MNELSKNQIFKIDDITKLENLIKIVDYCKYKYGNLLMIEFYGIVNNQKIKIFEFKDCNAKNYNLDDAIYENIYYIDLYFLTENNLRIKVMIDKEKKQLTIKKINIDIKVGKNKNDIQVPLQTIDQAFSDKTAKYYEFDTGRIAKYDSKTNAYYTLNSSNCWVPDERVFSWIIGAEYGYNEIHDVNGLKKR